jgi:hypothetical protein
MLKTLITKEQFMFSIKKKLLITSLILSSGIATLANAAGDCATCGGYFYTAIMQVNTNGIVDYQYARRGAYASEDECVQAWDLDMGNNDSWLPFFGSPKCVWHFETDYDAYDAILENWNLAAPPGNGGTILANDNVIKNISDLINQFNIKEYKHKVNTIITDPNNENDAPVDREG